MWNSSIWPTDTTLSGATILSQSGLESNGNERVLHIPQTPVTDGLMSYWGHSWEGDLTPLQRSSRCILQPLPTGQAWLKFEHSYYDAAVQLVNHYTMETPNKTKMKEILITSKNHENNITSKTTNEKKNQHPIYQQMVFRKVKKLAIWLNLHDLVIEKNPKDERYMFKSFGILFREWIWYS